MPDALTAAPDAEAIRQDLYSFTARWHELPERGEIELRALGENRTPQVARFPLDMIEDAVEFAMGMNRLGMNIYAVRNPVRRSAKAGHAASDADVIAALYLWADCDDGPARDNVKRFDGPRLSRVVVTGRTPHPRVHAYWELADWCHDLDEWRAVQVSIAAHFGSDSTVVNPSRIMRLAGTITHPASHKRAKGYVSELCETKIEGGAPVPFEQMQRLFAGARKAPTAASGGLHIDTGATPTSLDRSAALSAAQSGREWHNNVVRLVASYVARGLSDAEIHALTDPLTTAGYTVEQTRREVQIAIDGARQKGWTPEPYAQPAQLEISAAPVAPEGLEWFDDVQPAMGGDYIIKAMIDQGAMSVVYGPSNSGKTFFAIDLAFHIAIGADWRGRRVSQAGVLYLAAEGGRGIINRIAALRDAHGVVNVPFAVKRAGLDLLRAQADLQAVVDLAEVVRQRVPGQPLLIVVDTLSRVMAGGDENSAQDMTALIRNIDAIRSITGAHIMLVHHTGKDTARGARGHSSLRAATDTEIEVSPPSEDGAPRMALVTKQREHAGGESYAFTLKNITLGHDQDGDPVTTCLVEHTDSDEAIAAAKAKKGLGVNQKIIADTFDQMRAEGIGRPNPGGVGMPEPGVFWCVELDELRTLARGKMVASDTRSAFNQAMRVLTQERGIFATGGNMAWRTDKRIK